MVKDTILHQFTAIDSKLCVLICTSAFGMGINCSGVSRIIHWGPPNDIETYIQQTGRSGREGELSYCTLLFGKGLRRFCNKDMLAYCQNNSECRRNVLFKDCRSYIGTIRTSCTCCDVCSSNCNCSNCLITISNLH